MARTKNPLLSTARKDEILRGASRLFKEKGFHGTRTDEICAETGMSPGTLFRYFPDKRAIILAIAEREYANYSEDVARLATREGLMWLAQASGSDLEELIDGSRFNLCADSWVELSRDPGRVGQLHEMDRRLREDLAERLARGQVEGWVDPVINCQGTANILLAIFTGLIVDQQQKISLDYKATAAALGHILRAVLAREAWQQPQRGTDAL